MTLVATKKWESRMALHSYLSASGTPTLIIGATVEAPRAFYSFEVSAVGILQVGLYSSGLGSEPAMALLDGGHRAIVGHDAWVTWIDCSNPAVVASRRLSGVFFEFLSVDRDDQVVVLHELGALRIDSRGIESWTVDTEVIEDWHVDARGNLVLRIMDQVPRVLVSLDTGEMHA